MQHDPYARSGQSPAQGQRCAGCGHIEADAFARFCGVCGAGLTGGPNATPVDSARGQPRPTAEAYAAPAVPGAAPGPTRHLAPQAGGPLAQAPSPYGAPAGYGAPAPYGAPAGRAVSPLVYVLSSVGLAGIARYGAAVSAVFMLLPSLLIAFAWTQFIHRLKVVMDSWQTATVRVPVAIASVNLNMNFIDLLGMRPFYNSLVYWDDRLGLVFLLTFLVPWLFWIVYGAILAVIFALIYNALGGMGGGTRLTLQPTDAPLPSASAWPPAGHSPGTPAGWAPGGR